MVHVAILAMVKNEEKRIHVTLNSIKGFADSLIIYDTGSTDKTLDIIQNFCKENKIPLRLKHGTFVDFSTSRNVSLEFAETFADIDFIVLMDANDELQGGQVLRTVVEQEINNKEKTAYLVCQKLKRTSGLISFYNVRMIKPRCGWRYQGLVHEGFELNNTTILKVSKLPEPIILYQDRDEDAEKSQQRFSRDKELLMGEHLAHPENPRTIYYLAQTLDMLEDFNTSIKYHEKRANMDGFVEEKFVSAFRVAFLKTASGWDEALAWYMRAYLILRRSEPVINIAEYYRKMEKWDLGYHFSKLACELSYPEEALFYVDRKAYEYDRWISLAINAFNYRKITEGYEAIKNANSSVYSNQFDKEIRTLYDKVVAENIKLQDPNTSEPAPINKNSTTPGQGAGQSTLISLVPTVPLGVSVNRGIKISLDSS